MLENKDDKESKIVLRNTKDLKVSNSKAENGAEVLDTKFNEKIADDNLEDNIQLNIHDSMATTSSSISDLSNSDKTPVAVENENVVAKI